MNNYKITYFLRAATLHTLTAAYQADSEEAAINMFNGDHKKSLLKGNAMLLKIEKVN